MDKTIEKLLSKGVSEHKKGNLKEAEEIYKSIIEINNLNTSANFNLGILKVSLEDYKAASLHFKIAIKNVPNNEMFWDQYNGSLLNDYMNGFQRNVSNKNKDYNLEKDNFPKANQDSQSTQSFFERPSPIEYKEHYRPGMGTENVGGFLRSMVHMLRPKRILEIGAGYTTPFLLEALVNNERVFDDGNLFESFSIESNYDPKFIIIDNMSQGELIKRPGMKSIIDSKYTEFIESSFEGHAEELNKSYGNFDFVWFDCGGKREYESFMSEYWDICSNYIFFHYTYSNGKPNDLHEIILRNIKGNPIIFDILEPHKKKQGSITMIRKESL